MIDAFRWLIYGLVVMNALAAAALSEKELNTIVNETLQGLEPTAGLSISVTGPADESALSYTCGFANLKTRQPVSDGTLFPLPGAGLSVCAVLALRILEEHPECFPLGLDTCVSAVLDARGKVIFSDKGVYFQEDGRSVDLTDCQYYRSKTGQRFDFEQTGLYGPPQLSTITVKHLLLGASGLADVFGDLNIMRFADVFGDLEGNLDRIGKSRWTHLEDVYIKICTPGEAPEFSDSPCALETLQYFGLMRKAPADPVIPWQSQVTDYCLMLIILERVSAKSLNALLEEFILKPLDLPLDAIRFVEKGTDLAPQVARRYAYLSSNEEIEAAITQGTLLHSTTEKQARILSPKYLSSIGRAVLLVDSKQSRSALEVQTLPPIGFNGIDGVGLILARPAAYAQFFKALMEGELLSPRLQKIYESGFTAVASPFPGFESAMGFGSRRMWPVNDRADLITTVGGLLVGGEQRILYNHSARTAVVIAMNCSGQYGNLGCLAVAPMEYLGYKEQLDLSLKLAH